MRLEGRRPAPKKERKKKRPVPVPTTGDVNSTQGGLPGGHPVYAEDFQNWSSGTEGGRTLI